jgi:integrase
VTRPTAAQVTTTLPPVATTARRRAAKGRADTQRLLERYPSRIAGTRWPTTDLVCVEALALVLERSGAPVGSARYRALERGLSLLFDWLGEEAGESFQERFLASGADALGADWSILPSQWLQSRGEPTPSGFAEVKRSLVAAIAADLIRPSFAWLLTGAKGAQLASRMTTMRDPDGLAQLRQRCAQDPRVTETAEASTMRRVARIIAAKGGVVADITIGDLLEIYGVEAEHRGQAEDGAGTSFKALRDMGIFGPGVPTLREIRSSGQRSVEELVDRYHIVNRPVRDLLVDYITERRPAVDYTTLCRLAYALAGCFWADLETHHPDIASLHLPPGVATAWKQRLATKQTTQTSSSGATVTAHAERRSSIEIMASVRAFYLDLAQWALGDPERYGRWVAPSPINRQELSRRKVVKRRKARMDARTRERLPVLPVLVRSLEQWRTEATELLVAGRAVEPGERFAAAGKEFVRARRRPRRPGGVWAEDPDTGNRRSLDDEEDHAFWAWAVIGVLRLTGVRIEELLELSHHSLIEYRLPSSGELVPLLSIAPSKTDAERLLVVSPELAEVLGAIIRRVRDETGTVPLVRSHDRHELVWMPEAPMLFQGFGGAERQAMSVQFVRRLLTEALKRSGLVDHDGTPLHWTPHDFRRVFITDAIRNGLPPHIAQVLAGHDNLSVTMGYKAVYPDEAIEAHLAFLARRRALRPSEEYRTPTEEEWEQFIGNFERRKVSIGTCARAFGTPCVHEHACVRCSMLWPDPAQRGRLVEIRDSLIARIEEAKREGWLGEVEGLELSLAGARSKLAEVEPRAIQAVRVELQSQSARGAT